MTSAASYIPLLLLLAVAVLASAAILVLTHLLGPRLPNSFKNSAFECGFPPVGDARHRISVRYYLVAILFLLFDIEVVFLFPWAVIYKKYLSVNAFILAEMGVFLGVLLLGYFYALAKGAFEWD